MSRRWRRRAPVLRPGRRQGRLWLTLMAILVAVLFTLVRLDRQRWTEVDPRTSQRPDLPGRQDERPQQGSANGAGLDSSLTSGQWPARLKHVIDGDSFYVETLEGKEFEIRLVGINAPEMDSPEGPVAREFNRGLLEAATSIEIEPESSGPVDKHGRVLAWVWLELPAGSIAPQILLNEHMVRYAGVPLFKYADSRMKYYERLRMARDYSLGPGSRDLSGPR